MKLIWMFYLCGKVEAWGRAMDNGFYGMAMS